MSIHRILAHASRVPVLAVALLLGTAGAAAAQEQPSTFDLATGEQVILAEQSGPIAFAGCTLVLTNFTGMLGVSSAAAYVVTVGGEASDGTIAAERGHMLLIPPLGGSTTRARFDAARLASGLSEAQRTQAPAFTAGLAALGKAQARGVFLGRLGRTAFNVGAPGSTEGERAARSVVGEAAVRTIRFSGTDDLTAIEQKVADDFLAALGAGDARAVAALMDPSPFGSSDLRSGGVEARIALAEALIAERDWSAALREAQAVRNPAVANGWTIRGPLISGTIMLRPLGEFIFVRAIETEETP